jgi:uncharacterized metal-binding protein YceD (DUF177 family)
MLKVFIQGLKDGMYDVDVKCDASMISELSPEYFGDINLLGKLRIIGKRYAVTAKVLAQAKLECDISLEEFIEKIEVEIKSSFFADNNLFYLNGESDIIEKEEHIIHEDDKYLDLTNDIREELIVNLPMKRIAPSYRGKSFEEIHPEISDSKKVAEKKTKDSLEDDRWSALKNLKLN